MERVEKSNGHLRTEIYPGFKKPVVNLLTVINSELKSGTVNLKLAWAPGAQGGSCWSCDSLCLGLKHHHFPCCPQVRTVGVQLVYLRRGKTMPSHPKEFVSLFNPPQSSCCKSTKCGISQASVGVQFLLILYSVICYTFLSLGNFDHEKGKYLCWIIQKK